MATPKIELPEVIDVGEQLRQMVVPLRQALEQGEQHALYLDQLAKEQRDRNRQVRHALRAVDPDWKARTAKTKRASTAANQRVGVTLSNGTATGFGVTIEACEPWVEKISEIVKRNGFATQRDVYESLNSDQGTSSSVFRYLRHIGFLGKNGKDKPTKREKWIIMDDDAYDKAVKELKEQENG